MATQAAANAPRNLGTQSCEVRGQHGRRYVHRQRPHGLLRFLAQHEACLCSLAARIFLRALRCMAQAVVKRHAERLRGVHRRRDAPTRR